MTPEQIDDFISDAYDAPVGTVSMLCERINRAESDLDALRSGIRALLTKPATVEGLDPEATRLVEGALRQLQDYLRSLLPGADAGREGGR